MGSPWLAVALALFASACAERDPTALRDWATLAATTIAYQPAAQHYAPPRERDAPIRRAPARPAPVPYGPAPATPPPAPPPPPENRAARRDAQADAVLALQSVAAAWLDSLAKLAGGEAVPDRQAMLALDGARIARADATAAAGAAALRTALGAPPPRADEPPAAALRRLVEQGNAPFQAVMGALREQVVQLGGGESEEREAIILQTEREAARARSTTARQEAQDTRDALLTGQSGRGAARQAYLGVLERIMETHRMLRAQSAALGAPETGAALRRAEASLRRAVAGLPR